MTLRQKLNFKVFSFIGVCCSYIVSPLQFLSFLVDLRSRRLMAPC